MRNAIKRGQDVIRAHLVLIWKALDKGVVQGCEEKLEELHSETYGTLRMGEGEG